MMSDDFLSKGPEPGPTPGPGPLPPPPGNPYGAPVGPPVPPHPQATTTLILGIVGVVACGIAAPFAWFIGGKAKKEVRASNGAMVEDTSLKMGYILGIIGSVLLVLSIFAVIAFFALFGWAINEAEDQYQKEKDRIESCELQEDRFGNPTFSTDCPEYLQS